jgi:catechol-2,3-dioxygenase
MENNIGIRHLALKVKNFEKCFNFYTQVLGMKIDWRPDDNNAYLTNGTDNLALHYDCNVSADTNDSRLDHFGIFVKNKSDIDVYFKHMKDNNVKIHKEKKIHRDGSISFYVEDPDGNILQILWHPTLSNES